MEPITENSASVSEFFSLLEIRGLVHAWSGKGLSISQWKHGYIPLVLVFLAKKKKANLKHVLWVWFYEDFDQGGIKIV